MAIVVRRLREYVQWLYFQYIIHLGVYVYEPWEVRIFNSLIILMLCCTIYTTYLFMPGHIHMWINVFRWLSASTMESLFGTSSSLPSTAASLASAADRAASGTDG